MFFDEFRPYLKNDPEEYDQLAFVTQHPDRPRPNREADQIFMLPGSQLTQAKLIAPYLADKSVVFVGDGDCMALSLQRLLQKGTLPEAPERMVVLDFDLRIVKFVRDLAREWKVDDQLEAYYYNVADPIPPSVASSFDVFYVNPPYGSANEGRSGIAFLSRGIELSVAVGTRGIAVLPYQSHMAWSKKAMMRIQSFMVSSGFVVSEMLTGMHLYHLDDRPDLRSGCVILERALQGNPPESSNRALSEDELHAFYGRNSPTNFPRGIDFSGQYFFEDSRVPSDFLPQ